MVWCLQKTDNWTTIFLLYNQCRTVPNTYSSGLLLESNERRIWFQQDRARTHTSNLTEEFLEESFEDRIILFGLRAPHSPNLSPPDFLMGLY